MPKTTEEIYRELLAKGDAAQQQANDLLAQYDNRAAFAYDPNADGSFQALKNQYVHQGRRAMEDTMGQATNLTGGYSSSYSQNAGNQAYDEYLTNLNAQIPALAQQARAAYDAEGQRMLDRYNLALNAANTAYSQGRDALGDLRYEQEWAQQQKAYEDELAYRQWQQQQSEQDRAYQLVMQMLSTGQTPDAQLLAQAGISADYAKSMANYYKQQAAKTSAGSSGSGSGSRGSSSGGSGSGSTGSGSTSTTQTPPAKQYTTQEINDAYNKAKQAILMSGQTGNINYAVNALDQYADYLTPEMAAELMDMLDRIRKNIANPDPNGNRNRNSGNSPGGGGGKWVDAIM